MDSSKTGQLRQQATCYVYVFWLRNVVLKLPTLSLCVSHKRRLNNAEVWSEETDHHTQQLTQLGTKHQILDPPLNKALQFGSHGRGDEVNTGSKLPNDSLNHLRFTHTHTHTHTHTIKTDENLKWVQVTHHNLRRCRCNNAQKDAPLGARCLASEGPAISHDEAAHIKDKHDQSERVIADSTGDLPGC